MYNTPDRYGNVVLNYGDQVRLQYAAKLAKGDIIKIKGTIAGYRLDTDGFGDKQSGFATIVISNSRVVEDATS